MHLFTDYLCPNFTFSVVERQSFFSFIACEVPRLKYFMMGANYSTALSNQMSELKYFIPLLFLLAALLIIFLIISILLWRSFLRELSVLLKYF
jgi:hypothetical protein